MTRVSRAGREVMVLNAIDRLVSEGKYKMFTKGEICRKMGRKSDSHIKKILDSMVDDGLLIWASTAIDGYNHEISIYGKAAKVYQHQLPSHEIIVNGEVCQLNHEGDK